MTLTIVPTSTRGRRTKEEAYDFQADLIRDVVDYDRDGSVKYDAELFTDATAHMCRLNEFAEQGMERLEKTCDLDDVPTPQTFRRAVRNVERYKMKKDTLPGQTQSRWVAPEHVYEPRMVSGELRDTLEEKWAINPHDPEGEASVWHCRTEKAIEQQVEWLRDRGIIDDGDSFDIRIDFTTHDYNRHSSTDGKVPIGVHYQSYHDTYYAWKELQATIKIDGHAFLIASVNFTRANDKFQCLRYLVDRAEELVNVDTILADSEFGINKFLQYLDHRGLDYVVRKEMRRPVREKINEEIDGEGGWTDYTITTSGNLNHRKTTLVALKKYHKSKAGKKQAEGSKADDEEPETTLSDFIDGGEGEQLTFEDMEADEGDPASEYFAVLTNKEIESDGIKPAENPIAHDPEKTAWGIGRLYRDRWSVETKFRDRKKRFQPQTRSRDLGYRRYLWMMASLIYNGWVMLNTNVSNSSPIRDAGEIVVKQNTYIDELDRRVFAELDVEIDLHFPDHEFG